MLWLVVTVLCLIRSARLMQDYLLTKTIGMEEDSTLWLSGVMFVGAIASYSLAMN